MKLSDGQEHFIANLGEACEAAAWRASPSSSISGDGRLIVSVPRSSPISPNDQEIDHTGINPYIEIDDELVMLERVVSNRVFRPA